MLLKLKITILNRRFFIYLIQLRVNIPCIIEIFWLICLIVLNFSNRLIISVVITIFNISFGSLGFGFSLLDIKKLAWWLRVDWWFFSHSFRFVWIDLRFDGASFEYITQIIFIFMHGIIRFTIKVLFFLRLRFYLSEILRCSIIFTQSSLRSWSRSFHWCFRFLSFLWLRARYSCRSRPLAVSIVLLRGAAYMISLPLLLYFLIFASGLLFHIFLTSFRLFLWCRSSLNFWLRLSFFIQFATRGRFSDDFLGVEPSPLWWFCQKIFGFLFLIFFVLNLFF